MKSKNVSLSLWLVALLMVAAIWFSRRQPQRQEAVQRHPPSLQFTAEALCQLRCLNLQRTDAEQVMATGLVLYHKSNRNAQPCPVWVLQGRAASGQTYRLRLEQCRMQTVVVLVEQIDTPSACNCSTPSGPLPAVKTRSIL